MSIESQKSELLQWIQQLKDQNIIQHLILIKRSKEEKKQAGKRGGFGTGKHIFTYVAEDFNEPLQDFDEYMK